MARFFVATFLLTAIFAQQQKLSLAVPADLQAESTHHGGLVSINFGAQHSGKKYSSNAELTSLAHSSAQQARTAVRNQQTAGLQAALGAQTGYARAAEEAALAAKVALTAKQVIVQNLQQQLDDAQQRLQEERGQYQQALKAASIAQRAVQQSQQQLGGVTAALAAIQQSAQEVERVAAAMNAVAASQHHMVQEAEQRLSHVHSRLSGAQAELQATKQLARKAAASAQQAQTNAEASAQLAAVSNVAVDADIEEHESEFHH